MNFFREFVFPRVLPAMVLMIFAISGTQGLAQSETSIEPDVGIRFQPPTMVALTNATVVDANGAIPNATLLIDDGRIKALGTGIEIPDDAEVVDCHGDYLYPTFVDAYVEFDSEELVSDGQHWNENVTPHRDMSESIKLEDSKLESLREAGIGIVLAAPNQGIFKGQSCVIATSGTDLATSMLRSDGFQHLRLYPTRRSRAYPNSPMGAVALVRQTLSDANWYQTAKRAAMAQPQLSGP
jgi:N-acetylglucosamine-6-phosphate deacetylase